MKKCSNLQCALGVYGGGLFADNDCFCSNCGGKLVPKEEVNCQCGHRLGDNDKFCSGCGLPREEAVKKDELKEVAELVHETTRRMLKDANMSLPSLVCVHCGRSFENHDFPCPGCGQDPRR